MVEPILHQNKINTTERVEELRQMVALIEDMDELRAFKHSEVSRKYFKFVLHIFNIIIFIFVVMFYIYSKSNNIQYIAISDAVLILTSVFLASITNVFFSDFLSKHISHVFDRKLITEIQILDEERMRVFTFIGDSYDSVRPLLSPVQRMEMEIRIGNIEGSPWPEIPSRTKNRS